MNYPSGVKKIKPYIDLEVKKLSHKNRGMTLESDLK